MSLTAIFKRAPQRYAEVGPSLELNQPITYTNGGISLRVFDTKETITNFTAIVGQAKITMLRDRGVLSYASVSTSSERVDLIASYIDVSATVTPAISQGTTQLQPEIHIEDAKGFVYPTKKVQRVSVEA